MLLRPMQLASQIFGDLRNGLRLLARRPVFAAAAVLTLAIGAGASSAVFSAVRTVLLAPLPFRDPGRLVTVWDQNLAARIARSPVSDANYADWKRLNRCFSAMAAHDTWAPTLVSGGDPETLTGAVVDSDFFAVLGVQPLIGHGFDRREIASGARPVILSYGLWQRRFGGDPRIIGRSIQFSDRVAAVAGVMPPDFMHPGPDIRGVAVEIWNAKRFQAESDRRNDHLYVIARLKPEIVPEQAQMEMTLLSERLAQQHPENAGYQARVVSLQTDLTGDVKRLLWVSFAAVMCLTLIACANLATLLLSRAAEREREFAIRRAMGAPGWQLVSQSLAECGGIALIGGSLALVLASAGIRTLGAAAAGYIPRMRYLRLDSMVVVVVFSVSLLCSLLCGIAPAMRAARLNPSDSFGDSSRGSSQGRRHKRRSIVFLTADVAFTFMLVVSGALLIESFQALLRVDPGFDASHVWTAEVALPWNRYANDERAANFHRALVERVSQLPAVQAAAASSWLPFRGEAEGLPFYIADRQWGIGVTPKIPTNVVTAGVFPLLKAPLEAGRMLAGSDAAEAPAVVLINEAMARRYWPGSNPLGQRISLTDPSHPDWRTIVGVVGDVRSSLGVPPGPQIYLPLAQYPSGFMYLLIRTQGETPWITEAVRRIMRQMDSAQAIAWAASLDDLRASSLARERFLVWLVGLFGAVAMVLTIVGVYGAMSYAVHLRHREVAIRIALGAHPAEVYRRVLRDGLNPVWMGLAFGLAGIWAIHRILASFLFRVGPGDSLTILAATGTLIAAAIAAIAPSARTASRTDPSEILRID